MIDPAPGVRLARTERFLYEKDTKQATGRWENGPIVVTMPAVGGWGLG